MDKAVLVGPDIEEGRKFLELLRNAGVRVDAALWQKDEIFGRWSFIIVAPIVEELGVRETYRRLIEILSNAPQRPTVDLLDVSLLTPESRFYKSLHRELRRARDLVVTKRPVGDHVIEAAFVYFVR